MAKYDKVIPPGQEGHITLAVTGAKVAGAFTKTATVTTNDPEHPQMTLTLAGKEISYIKVAPSERIYLQGLYGDKIEKTLTITSAEKKDDFRVTGLSSNVDDKITYRLEEGKVRGEYVVRLFKNPQLPTMNTFGTLTIATNSENVPEKTVSVQIVTKGTITVQPSTVNFGRLKFGRTGQTVVPAHKSFTLLKARGEFAVEGIEVNSDLYTWELEEVVPRKRYKVNVTFNPPMKTSPRQNEFAEMTIRTNDPNEPQLQVRLIARSK